MIPRIVATREQNTVQTFLLAFCLRSCRKLNDDELSLEPFQTSRAAKLRIIAMREENAAHNFLRLRLEAFQ
jgi:hypothetical protein